MAMFGQGVVGRIIGFGGGVDSPQVISALTKMAGAGRVQTAVYPAL